MDQERAERELRLKHGGLEMLQADERLQYQVQKEIEDELKRMKGVIHKLLYEDLADIDSRMFETYKGDEMFMDEWTKQLVERIFVGNDSPILSRLKELLRLTDKELYRQVRDKDITVGQFKSRCMEKLNGNQVKFIHYDDVVHMIHPEAQNLDLNKVDKWSKAAFGKPLN